MKKNILITGASKGIGKELAKGFANSEFNIFLTARNEELLKEISAQVDAKAYFICDLTNENELRELKNFIIKNKIDILINNAGAYVYEKIENMEFEQINKIITTNLTATAFLCAAAVAEMKANKWGRIVNIGS